YGDFIQMLRYVPLLARERGAIVIVACPTELKPVALRVPDVEMVIGSGESLPAFDIHVPVMSLPMAFGTTLKTVPANVPYVSANPRVAEAWTRRIDEAAK